MLCFAAYGFTLASTPPFIILFHRFFFCDIFLFEFLLSYFSYFLLFLLFFFLFIFPPSYFRFSFSLELLLRKSLCGLTSVTFLFFCLTFLFIFFALYKFLHTAATHFLFSKDIFLVKLFGFLGIAGAEILFLRRSMKWQPHIDVYCCVKENHLKIYYI